MKKYISIAKWPKEADIFDKYGNNETHDRHENALQANAVCMMLERDGYGGAGKIFPLETWVEVDEN